MQKNNSTQILTFSAIMTALGVILLLLGAMMPGMRIACAAVASVVVSLIVIRCGLLYALLSVIATAIIAFLVVPAKELALLYLVFFGPYALVKNLIERLHRLPLEWILKLMCCGIVAVLLFWFSEQVLAMVPELLEAHFWLYLPAVLVVFAAYDIVFSKLLVYLFERLRMR